MKSLHSLSYKTLFIILFFALAGIVFFLKIGGKTTKVSAAWWDESWHYRKAISITNSSGSNLTDFQVSVSIGTSQLIADGKMQTDCDDIRVTDINGNLLPYWIETGTCNTDITRIWIKINNLPSSGATPYIYYGNSSAITQSDSSILPKSCSNLNPFLGSGIYYIDPDQNKNTNPFQVYCDMTIDGGGWTLLSYTNNYSDLNFPPSMFTGYGTYNPSASSGNASIGSSLLNYIDVYDFMTTDLSNAQPYVPNGNLVYINNYTGGTKKPFGCLLSFPCGIACGSTQTSGLDLRGYSTSGVQEWSSNNVCSTSYTTNQWSLGYSGGDWLNSTLSGIYLEYWTGGTPSSARRSAMIKGNNDTGITHKIWVRETKPTNISYNTSTQSEESGGGPIAYWKFDEGVGSTVYDSIGNFNGSLTGTTIPTWQSEDQCISEKCLKSTGNGSVSIGNPSNFRINNNSITIETWVKFNSLDYSSNTGKLIGFAGKGTPDTAPGTASSGFWFAYDNRNNGKSFTYTCFGNSAGGYSGGNNNFAGYNYTFNNNTWYHLAITVSQNQGRLYINGKQLGAAKTFSGLQLDNTLNNLYIGSLIGGYNLPGNIDEVKIYPYARTADQIKLDYNSRGSTKGSSANLGVKSNTAPSLKSSLVAYYKFDEKNGTTVYDSSGNGNNGTFGVGSSAPTWTQGKFSTSLSFNGTSSYTNTIYNNTFDFSKTTISAWVKSSDFGSGYREICGKFLGGRSFFLELYNNLIDFNISGDGSSWNLVSHLRSQFTINDNKWHHIVGVYDGTKGYLYYDGNLINSGGSSGTIKMVNSSISIGGGAASGENINGYIDEVKIYNRALTTDEVKQDYNAGSAIQFGQTTQNIGGTTTSLDYCIPGDAAYCASPVAEWKMDEGIGTSIIDTSSNNKNGTFNNSPVWTQGKIGKALNFSYANNNSVTTTFNSQLTSYTAEAWIKPTGFESGNWNTIMATSNSYALWFELTSSKEISAHAFTTSTSAETATNGANIEIGKWYHIAVSATQNGTTTIYVNGVGLTSFTAGNSSWSGSDIITIGDLRASRNLNFNGSIDHVKIYNYIRTPAQITYDYNKGAPVGWWKLDECQGNIAYDWSGVGNTGSINIGPSGTQNSLGTCAVGTSAAWTNGSSGKINSSLNFDGTDDYVELVNNVQNLLGATTPEWSYSVWFKTNGSITSKKEILSNYDSATGDNLVGIWTGINADGNTGRIFIDIRGSGAPDYIYTPSGKRYDDSQWHQIIVTAKLNGHIKGYIDGNKFTNDTTSTLGNTNYIDNSILRVGALKYNNSLTEFWNGQIDDVRVYNYALTDEQIKQVYNGGAVNFQ